MEREKGESYSPVFRERHLRVVPAMLSGKRGLMGGMNDRI
jgi:hypothetical protein